MDLNDKNRALRILVIEDNYDIVENIADYLEADGHELDFAYDGIGGLHLALTLDYDVMVLDLMLPGMDGITLCRKLRQEGQKDIPILMLTARDTIPDKLEGFEAGADDYLVKPFSLEELGARLKALVKRSHQKDKLLLQVADLVMDPGTLTVHRDGVPVVLNRACLKILEILMRASPNVVTRRSLEYAMWGDAPPGSDALRSHLYSLRQKIDKPFAYTLLQTLHGVGYRLAREDEIKPACKNTKR